MFEKDEHSDIWNSIWAVMELLDFADSDLTTLDDELKLIQPGELDNRLAEINFKPEPPVMMHGEPVDDLKSESLAVLREVVNGLENMLITPRGLLKAINERGKAA